ncbi:MAG TPA: hypothetical protein VFX21_08580 [Acidimicrobiia bacterium]|nr:hypothetical protein [Acidimicrobiia bacterium]
MPRIIRDAATISGTTIATVHTSAWMIACRVCQQMIIAMTT